MEREHAGRPTQLADAGAAESLQYLLRAANATLRASASAEVCMDVVSDARTREVVREASLSIAVADHLLSEFMRNLANSMNLTIPPAADLPSLVHIVGAAPAGLAAKRLPPGGIVSLLYHLGSVMEETAAALKNATTSRWDSFAGYVHALARGAAGALAWLALSRTRVFLRRHHGAWQRALLSVLRPSTLALLLLAYAVLRVRRLLHSRLSARARLRRSVSHMSVMTRMWVLAAETFTAANIDRNASYSVMLSELSEQDFRDSAKPLARRVLEKTSLPRGAALWPQQGLTFTALRRGMDTVYAVMQPVHTMLRAARGMPAPVSWLAGLTAMPLCAATAAYYVLQPDAAAERAANILASADVEFIQFVWCLSDAQPLRWLTQRVLMRRHAVNTETSVAGVTCHVLANVPWERLHLTSEAVPDDAPIVADRRPAPALAERPAAPADFDVPRAAHAYVLRRAASAGSDRLVSEASAQHATFTIPEGDQEEDLSEPASRHSDHEQPLIVEALPSVTAGTGSALALDDVHKSSAAQGRAAVSASSVVSTDGADRDVPVLLYIHGGGFVGSMSVTDNLLLSRWLSKASAPMSTVYVHYTLSPKARFPTALLQAFAVYRSLRQRRRRVVVAGDSAGGNLSAALCLKCIQEGVPPPDSLVLCYPALCLNSSPSPSRALHINDPLVPVLLLEKLAAAYAPEEEAAATSATPMSADTSSVTSTTPASMGLRRQGHRNSSPGHAAARALAARRNPLMHPLYASDEDLRKFPVTHIITGGLDPLLDDSIDFNSRLRRLGVPGDLQVFRSLPHGFLMFEFLAHAAGAVEVVRHYCFEGLRMTSA